MADTGRTSPKRPAKTAQIAFRVAAEHKDRVVRVAGGDRKLSAYARRVVMESVMRAELDECAA